MLIKDRIVLLDKLLALNEQTGLPEGQVAGLAEFLADMPATTRESVLDHIHEGDQGESFGRFVKLANMDPAQRNKILGAMGIQIGGNKGFLDDFIGAASEGSDTVKKAVGDLVEMRERFQGGFLEPLAKLFGLVKLGK